MFINIIIIIIITVTTQLTVAIAFIKIWENCPRLFYVITNTTVNRLGFGPVGYSQKNWVGVCGPQSQNPYPHVYDQNLRFSLP